MTLRFAPGQCHPAHAQPFEGVKLPTEVFKGKFPRRLNLPDVTHHAPAVTSLVQSDDHDGYAEDFLRLRRRYRRHGSHRSTFAHSRWNFEGWHRLRAHAFNRRSAQLAPHHGLGRFQVKDKRRATLERISGMRWSLLNRRSEANPNWRQKFTFCSANIGSPLSARRQKGKSAITMYPGQCIASGHVTS